MTKEELIKDIGTAVGAAIIVMAKPLYDIVNKQSKILFARKKIESQGKIQLIINDIRAKLRVDRVEIFEYSNGESTLGGFPFLFGSMTFESKEDYLATRRREMQKFPTSWFSSILAPILPTNVRYCCWSNKGECVIDGKEKIIDKAAGEIIKSYDIKSSLMIKFTANIGDGVISLSSYHNNVDINEDDFNHLLSDVSKIWYHLKLKR